MASSPLWQRQAGHTLLVGAGCCIACLSWYNAPIAPTSMSCAAACTVRVKGGPFTRLTPCHEAIAVICRTKSRLWASPCVMQCPRIFATLYLQGCPKQADGACRVWEVLVGNPPCSREPITGSTAAQSRQHQIPGAAKHVAHLAAGCSFSRA